MSDKKQKRVLGRGLDALLGNSSDDENSLKPLGNINSFEIDINKIEAVSYTHLTLPTILLV